MSYLDERDDPGPPSRLWTEPTDVECESVVPEGEPSEAARECAETELADRADEIGAAK